jgi:putative selenate reductase molybdopterin-binding subunit
MKIQIVINDDLCIWEVDPNDTLLKTLRAHGYFGVKTGGCKDGECGACAIIFDGKIVNSCTILAGQADCHSIETIENLGEHPDTGWKKSRGLHPLQQAFIDVGAIQCGYCTPAMILAAKSLLDKNPNPTEKEIRESLSGVLCRCTGYLKPVQGVLRAAALLRGESVDPVGQNFVNDNPTIYKENNIYPEESHINGTLASKFEPKIWHTKETILWQKVGKPEPKVDAIMLAQGKPAFTADFEIRGMLYAKVLRSPVAHAWIKHIDTTEAIAYPGVAAVLTWKDIPRVVYSTAGQSDPIPGPLDSFSLDKKVRHVGDRVAFVAAETEEIANHALKLIKVEYDPLPFILNPLEAQKENASIIHDESEYVNFADSDPNHNLAAKIHIDIGNVDKGFAEADKIFESDYEVPKVQQAHIEPHVVITFWDENNRLVIRTSTQVPFHARRILAPVLKLPIKRIRVIKPRIGGGFGGKQEVLLEDVAAHLTIATGHPVIYEYSREEEFIGARSRHPMHIKMKTGVKLDGTITANEMVCISDTGAYGCHALTVTGNTGHKAMALYVGDGIYRKTPNIRFHAEIVYTNLPPSGAYRGYGVPQGFWAVERQMDKIARDLKIDPIEFRLKNSIRSGELHPFSTAWSEGREPRPEVIQTVGLEECLRQGKTGIEWNQKFPNPEWHKDKNPNLRHGIGVACVMQGTAIPYLDMGGASIKMNDDGSFNLLVGATDLGTGSDTILAQMAAEILGVSTDDMIVYSSDTDLTPFDKGAYASSTTYISGTAVVKAAEQVADKIRYRAVKMLSTKLGFQITPQEIVLKNGDATYSSHLSISLRDIAHDALHHEDQEQIMAVSSYCSKSSPPPFGAQFAEVTVDIETGQVTVDKLLMAVDSGVIINPITAAGQIEGGMTQALGYALCEEMTYDESGRPNEIDLNNYHIFRADEMPKLDTLFIETYEPSHPFGAKAVAEIPLDGVAPAVANAIFDACGNNIDTIPATPERVWKALQSNKPKGD